jgi:hypothetical protein
MAIKAVDLNANLRKQLGILANDDPRPSKYRAKRCYVNHRRQIILLVSGEKAPEELERFDSIREAQRWVTLKNIEDSGDITRLQRQVSFALMAPSYESIEPAIVSKYIADFVYTRHDGVLVVEDAKGYRTDVFKLKAKWLKLQDGIDITLV